MRFTALLSSLLVAALLLGGCQTNPETGRRQFTLLPASQVAAMGMEAKPQLIEEYGGEVPSQALRDYITQVGQSLVPHVAPEFSHIEWDFVVLDSDVINAFALPGGNVFISRGLLEYFSNEAQLAGVLGHEIGHVTGKHVDERISQAVAAEVGLGIVGGLTESQIVLLSAQLFSTGYQLRFGRSQELESDTLGMHYMVAAGYDPRGMVQVLEILRDASGGAAPPEILSTHPDPGRRVNDANRLIASQYSHTQNSPDYQLHQSRFEQQARPHLGPKRAAAGFPARCWCSHCTHLASTAEHADAATQN